jgi:4-aminobutyrate aminotransferase-like enzyme
MGGCQNTMRDEGGLVPTTDVHNCVVRIAPPPLLSDAQIDKSLEVFESVLKRGMK